MELEQAFPSYKPFSEEHAHPSYKTLRTVALTFIEIECLFDLKSPRWLQYQPCPASLYHYWKQLDDFQRSGVGTLPNYKPIRLILEDHFLFHTPQGFAQIMKMHRGAQAMAKDLGFEYVVDCVNWAWSLQGIWGNPFGYAMFTEPKAYTQGEVYEINHITKHLLEVAERWKHFLMVT